MVCHEKPELMLWARLTISLYAESYRYASQCRYHDTVEARSVGAWHQRLGAFQKPTAGQSVERGEKIVKEKVLKMTG